MKKILITGSNGQLGMSIQKIEKEYLDLRFEFTTSKVLDITEEKNVASFFKENNFDYCVNCAAYTNVEQAEKSPEEAFSVNAEGAKNLATACKKNKITLIHISTDYVFDGKKRKPYTVNDIPNPINEYGKSKLKGENHIKEILNDFFIVRTSWLYNKESGHNFYRTILKKATTETKLTITDQQTGCPTHTDNLAHFILGIITLENINYGIYHYTDNNPMTWFDFAYKILEENKMLDKVALEKGNNYRTFAARPTYSVLI